MPKRELEEINASSMADIAFLLLVFFLVTTTFNKVKVVPDELPQKPRKDQPIVKVFKYNILDIVANKNDAIQLEEDTFLDGIEEIDQLTTMVRDFYDHPRTEDKVKWPMVYELSESMALDSVAKYEALFEVAPKDLTLKSKVSLWTKRSNAAKMFSGTKGSIPMIDDNAVIAIKMDNTTKYATYITILDAIMAGINELKEEMVQEIFDRPLSSFDARLDDDKNVLDLLEIVYPKRVMKKKSVAGTE